MKYKTLAELRDAYARKELTEPLVIDHHDSQVFIPLDEDWVKVETVMKIDNCDLIRQALELLGIPSEHG